MIAAAGGYDLSWLRSAPSRGRLLWDAYIDRELAHGGARLRGGGTRTATYSGDHINRDLPGESAMVSARWPV
jgi:hypothetical protein